MSTIKITALPALTTPDANKANTIFVVVDTSSGVPTTKQMSLANLEFSVDDTGVLARAHANSAYLTANAAYLQANIATPAFAQANTANNTANAALILATSGNAHAYGAFTQANTANTLAAATEIVANVANTTAVSALTLANTANITATAAFVQANIATPAFNAANVAFIHANSAYELANSIVVTANVAYSDIIFARANTAYNVANLALSTANTANAKASNSVSKFGDVMTGDLEISTGNLKVTGTGYANVAGKLTVGPSGFVSLPDITAQLTGASLSYIQMNQQNIDYRGSADFVITADNGDDGNNYIDIGMAGSGYYDANFPAYLPNDGWLIVQGKEAQGNGGNLLIGTSATNTDIVVMHGGTGFESERARFKYEQGLTLKYNTVSTSNATGSLVVQGGIGANGNIHGDAIYANGVDLATRLDAAYALANATSNTTNTAYITAAFTTANTANVTAHLAYDTANTATSTAALSLLNSTSGGAVANVANATANYANTVSNTAFVLANTLNVTIVSVSTVANTANTTAAAALTLANTANNTATSGLTLANAANILATSASSTAVAGFNAANVAYIHANSGYNLANTLNVIINTTVANTIVQANTASITASAAFNKANGAYDTANTALALGSLAVTLESSANASLIRANAAFDAANNANTKAQAAFDAANAAVTLDASTYLANTSGTFDGDLNVTGMISFRNNVTFDYQPTASPATFVVSTGDAGFTIRANTVGWTFANTGTISFPDATFQTTAFTDELSNAVIQQTSTYFVDPNRTDTYTEIGTILYPFKTIANANTAAVTAGHSDSNPAYIVLLGNITENVSFTKGGIWLTSLGSGTHGSPIINGQITIDGGSASISENHFSISNLRLVPTANNYGVVTMGSNPQRLFLRDMWIDASGNGACVKANGNASSVTHLNTAHLTHTSTDDVYCVEARTGLTTMTDIETSGSITVAHVSTGANLVLSGSEIDANNAAAVEVYGGTVTVTNSVLTNANTTGHGIALKTPGSVALLGNVLFNVRSGTNARAVYGVPSTACYYQYMSFYPGSNQRMSSNVANSAMATTFTFTAP